MHGCPCWKRICLYYSLRFSSAENGCVLSSVSIRGTSSVCVASKIAWREKERILSQNLIYTFICSGEYVRMRATHVDSVSLCLFSVGRSYKSIKFINYSYSPHHVYTYAWDSQIIYSRYYLCIAYVCPSIIKCFSSSVAIRLSISLFDCLLLPERELLCKTNRVTSIIHPDIRNKTNKSFICGRWRSFCGSNFRLFWTANAETNVFRGRINLGFRSHRRRLFVIVKSKINV